VRQLDIVLKMKCAVFSLISLCGIISVSGSKSEDIQKSCLPSADTQQQRSCLLQVQQSSKVTSIERHAAELAVVSQFTPAHGNGGNLEATLPGVCEDDSYSPSAFEQEWCANAEAWTKDETTLCPHLGAKDTWIHENIYGTVGPVASGNRVFSQLCKKGSAPQYLEPLAGVLRDPRVICEPFDEHNFFGIDWLVMADYKNYPSGKRVFFDAGGTRFMDAMRFFVSIYDRRGLTFDEIYAWEAVPQGIEGYWENTPPELRQKWEPKLTFYDGIPITADPNSHENPVKRILEKCKPEDFCAFKLDIDTPSVEFPIIEQLMASPAPAAVLDEFFFEHHVHGVMENWGWDKDVNGTFADSYRIFTQLRQMGIRAHSWI